MQSNPGDTALFAVCVGAREAHSLRGAVRLLGSVGRTHALGCVLCLTLPFRGCNGMRVGVEESMAVLLESRLCATHSSILTVTK